MRRLLSGQTSSMADRSAISVWFDSYLESRALLVAEVGVLGALAASLATRAWQERIWIGFVLVAAAVVIWSPELRRSRFRRWWFGYIVGIYVYTLARAYADETAIDTRVDYVISVERFVFGVNPGVWLQQRYFDGHHLDVFDFAAVGLHWSFFIAPHVLAVSVALWDRARFSYYSILIVGTMFAGLVLFYVVPTAPPWFAGATGVIHASRVMDFVGGDVSGGAYESLYAALGEPNSFAAMPSAHMAVTFSMFLYSWHFARRFRWALLGYSALMGLALVYMAEHYVVDLAAGIGCSLLVYVLAMPLARRLGAVESELSAVARPE